MNKIETGFDDLYVLEFLTFEDERGEFIKTIHQPSYESAGLDYWFTENFYSVSKKDVLRGMHFQVPPEDYTKLVYVVRGKILDVIIDLRTSASTFGKFFSVELSEENRKAVYIGKGFGHGFLALEPNSVVEYHTTKVQSKQHEQGILWSSFGFPWPISRPILSERDKKMCSLSDFTSPFK